MVARPLRSLTLPALGFWLSLLLLIGVLVAPVNGQPSLVGNRSETAPVLLDGRILFQVNDVQGSNNEYFTAQARAAIVNRRLARVAALAEHTLRVQVIRKDDALTLQLDEQQLLTVTKQDAGPGVEVFEQAQEWQYVLNQALTQAKNERTSAYQQRSVIWAIAALIGAIACHIGLLWLRGYWRRSRVQQPHRSKIFHRFGLTMTTGGQVLIWLGAAFMVSELFPVMRAARYAILSSFFQPLFKINQKEYGLLDLLFVVVLIVGLWSAVRGMTLLLRSRILTGIDRGTQEVISVLTQYILTFLGLMVILQLVGVDVSALLILGSALGVGIGFGLQNIVNNFISGIIILLNRPIEVGDFINLGELVGTVERVGARSTEIRTLDQVTIIVPNAHFLEKEVMNWSHGSAVTRLHLPVGVAYGSNIAVVQVALLEAVTGHPDILAHPQPQVFFQGFGDSALNFEVLIWICEPRQQYRIKSDLNYRIEASLQRHQVDVPFPQRDLHVRSPQLDHLIQLFIQQQRPPQPQLYYPNAPSPAPTPEETVDLRSHLQPLQSINRVEVDFDELVAQMRGPNGVVIKDRRFRLQVYRQCFIGTDAVAWLMRTQRATKDEALRMGQMLIERGLMHHVLDEHRFTDGYLFYRFYADEQELEGQSRSI